MIDIQILTCHQDNYCYVVHLNGVTLVVDPGDAQPVLDYLERHGCTLSLILSTHMHQDHCAGNVELKRLTGCLVVGGDKRIAAIDVVLAGENTVAQAIKSNLSGLDVPIEVFYTPGHTSADCCYYLSPQGSFPGALFSGDVLFSGCCGRIFEGTMAEMFNSLQQLKALPPETLLYCGHEYSLANYRFAAQIEPDSAIIGNKLCDLQLQRDRNEKTIPVSLQEELSTNPFLRTNDPALRKALKMEGATELEVFTELRNRKNHF